jgi:hypothetical protein
MGPKMSKVRYGVVILVALFLFGLVGQGRAAIPQTLNFQGYLTNPGGTPITGTVAMVISIYAQESGGTALWTESHPDVVLLSGVYNVLLGSITPLGLLFNAPYYLGIQVATDPEMTPRLPLSSVGYAYRAGMAEQALIQGFPVSPAIPSANQVLKFNGTNWVPSSVNLSTDTSGVLPISKGGTDPGMFNFVPRTNTVNILDSTGDVGMHPSIAIGADGYPVISYYDATNGDLKVTKCGDASCIPASASLRTLDSTGNVGMDTSITIGVDGYPIISYYDATNARLKVAHCGDVSCSTLDPTTPRVLDSTGNVGQYTSIAIGADGYPVISYYDVSYKRLKVAKCGDASCSTLNPATPQVLDSAGDVGKYTSIAIGADGYPVISYYLDLTGSLKVAKCGDASCTPASANLRILTDPIGIVGGYTSIAIGADGYPVISYSINGDLTVTKCANSYCLNNWRRR